MYRGLIRRSSDMRSSNPVLRDKTFSGQHAEGEVMTMDGMVGKTGILFVLLLIAAGWTWTRFYDVLAEAGPQAAMGAVRSEERRVGKGGVRKCSMRGSRDPSKK